MPMLQVTRLWCDRGNEAAPQKILCDVNIDAVLFVENKTGRGQQSRIYLDTASSVHFIDVVEPREEITAKLNALGR